jgi:hypothetical protein
MSFIKETVQLFVVKRLNFRGKIINKCFMHPCRQLYMQVHKV